MKTRTISVNYLARVEGEGASVREDRERPRG